jgi:alpha-mannosidase
VGQSLFRQAYVLQSHSPILTIRTEVDWQERHTLVKAAFPLNLEADLATYEMPFGAIGRTTRRQSEREKAQWEVPALRWAELGDGAYGVSLLNDCKYGYDAQPSRLRLTLLRGAVWPNPEADVGVHRFSYGLYPHGGDWRAASQIPQGSAGTVRWGYGFNQPLRCVGLLGTGSLPTVGRFLSLPNENLVVSAFKQSEEEEGRWILRFYECWGELAELTMKNDADSLLAQCLELDSHEVVNLLEMKMEQGDTEISPWKITTLLFSGK